MANCKYCDKYVVDDASAGMDDNYRIYHSECKPVTFNDLTDYERGEYDCVHNHPVRDNESPDYYSGYGDAYAQEQIADARTTLLEKQYERV
jgi:oxalate decarboxylase/phosphoglucose isomerase-like protein (cupin superfamily)